MGGSAEVLAVALVAVLSFSFGLLQRRTTRTVVLRVPPRIGDVPRTELQAEVRL